MATTSVSVEPKGTIPETGGAQGPLPCWISIQQSTLSPAQNSFFTLNNISPMENHVLWDTIKLQHHAAFRLDTHYRRTYEYADTKMMDNKCIRFIYKRVHCHDEGQTCVWKGDWKCENDEIRATTELAYERDSRLTLAVDHFARTRFSITPSIRTSLSLYGNLIRILKRTENFRQYIDKLLNR